MDLKIGQAQGSYGLGTSLHRLIWFTLSRFACTTQPNETVAPGTDARRRVFVDVFLHINRRRPAHETRIPKVKT